VDDSRAKSKITIKIWKIESCARAPDLSGVKAAVEFAHGKTWGASVIHPTDKDLPGLKMKYLCDVLEGRKGKLIEIGSSAGKHLRSLRSLGYPFEFHGNDIDLKSLRLGHTVTPAVAFMLADGNNLPYRNELFDVVLLMDYLEHVPNPSLAVKEAMRILKVGGLMYLFVPCEGNPLSPYAMFDRIFGANVKKSKGHVQAFTHADIVDLVHYEGRVQSIYYSYHILGSFLDFSLFLLVYLSTRVAQLYWRHNRFYHGDSTNSSSIVALFNATLTCLNRLAYLESSYLKQISHIACGMHLVLTK
jgi:SAM-dependent methyltransferase